MNIKHNLQILNTPQFSPFFGDNSDNDRLHLKTMYISAVLTKEPRNALQEVLLCF